MCLQHQPHLNHIYNPKNTQCLIKLSPFLCVPSKDIVSVHLFKVLQLCSPWCIFASRQNTYIWPFINIIHLSYDAILKRRGRTLRNQWKCFKAVTDV